MRLWKNCLWASSPSALSWTPPDCQMSNHDPNSKKNQPKEERLQMMVYHWHHSLSNGRTHHVAWLLPAMPRIMNVTFWIFAELVMWFSFWHLPLHTGIPDTRLLNVVATCEHSLHHHCSMDTNICMTEIFSFVFGWLICPITLVVQKDISL